MWAWIHYQNLHNQSHPPSLNVNRVFFLHCIWATVNNSMSLGISVSNDVSICLHNGRICLSKIILSILFLPLFYEDFPLYTIFIMYILRFDPWCCIFLCLKLDYRVCFHCIAFIQYKPVHTFVKKYVVSFGWRYFYFIFFNLCTINLTIFLFKYSYYRLPDMICLYLYMFACVYVCAAVLEHT